jgi:Protein of unknown function (DUF3096)
MIITTAHLSPLLSIFFGILIFVFPRLLNYLVAIYLILAGLLGIGMIGRPFRARVELQNPPPVSRLHDGRTAALSTAPPRALWTYGDLQRSPERSSPLA